MMMRHGRRALLTVMACAVACGVSARPVPPSSVPIVRVDSGTLAGKRSTDVLAFLGVPYAGDAGGANRWKAPIPVTAWRGVRAADHFGADCQQDPPYSPPGGSPWSAAYMPTGTLSENCLFLNVWTGATAGRKPVMVWIHGGGFAGGSASVPIYDGAALARRGIVVVSINYRVGMFGFFAHRALTAEAGSSGNYGLMDQVAALRWVRHNIARFGGDPDQVTVAGQSAGAASVHALLAAPSAAGLFRRAIAESGSGMGIVFDPLAVAEAQGQRIAAAAGTSDLAALRRLPAAALARAANDPSVGPPGLRFRPVTEPHFLPNPNAQRENIPVLTGLTADETSTGPDWHIQDTAGLSALLDRRFGAAARAFAPLYPPTGSDGAQAAARALLREQATASLLLWAADRSPRSAPTFAYLFDHAQANAFGRRFGSFHTAEVPFVFGTTALAVATPNARDRSLERLISSYWVNFIRNGTPNGARLPMWPSLAAGKLMVLNDAPHALRAMAPDTLAHYRAYVRHGGRLGLF